MAYIEDYAIIGDMHTAALVGKSSLGRQLGNFPQAFSHVPLVNTASHLSAPDRPRRRGGGT